MTPQRKRILRLVGYPLLGLVVFVFAMHFTFPYDRLRDMAAHELSGSYDVGIAEISPGMFPGRFTLRNVTMTTRPTMEGEKPKTLQIDKVDLSIGLLALLGKTVSVDFDARIGEGRVFGNAETSQTKGFAVDLETEDVSLETVPGLAVVTGGAPITGPLAAKVKLSVPQGKWAQATGNIDVACSGCSIGDGVTKVKSPGPQTAFNSEGFTLPKIKLGELVAKVQITNGVVCIVKMETHSTDADLTVEGGLKLTDPAKDSLAQLYAVLKLSDEFKKQSSRNNDFDILLTTGARQPDGTSHFLAKTPLSALRWAAAKNPPPPMRECIGIAQPSTGTKPAPSKPLNLPPPTPDHIPQPPAPPVGSPTPPQPGPPMPTVVDAPAPPPPPPATAPVEPPLPQMQPEQPQPQPQPQPEAPQPAPPEGQQPPPPPPAEGAPQ